MTTDHWSNKERADNMENDHVLLGVHSRHDRQGMKRHAAIKKGSGMDPAASF
jgi:hypothetical protein